MLQSKKKQSRREHRYSCIAFYWTGSGEYGAAKYHNVEVDKPERFNRFTTFLKRKFPTLHHINVYGGISRDFIKQIPLSQL